MIEAYNGDTNHVRLSQAVYKYKLMLLLLTAKSLK